MFSGITNFIFGTTESTSGAISSSVDLHFSDAEDEWVLVDIDPSAQDKMNSRENHLPKLVLQLDFDSPLNRPVSASSTPSSPSPCPIPDNISPDSSWFITPPPCFTAGGHAPIEMIANPLENLLIEHPSMSVYGLRQRNRSIGSDSDRSESSDSNSPSRIATPPPTVVHRSTRHPSAVAAIAGMVARLENIKAMQKSENHYRSRKLRCSHLERTNKVQEFNSHGKRNRRKNFMAHPSGRSNNRKC